MDSSRRPGQSGYEDAWHLIRGAAVWLRLHPVAKGPRVGFVQNTLGPMLLTQASHLASIAALGELGHTHLPTAMTAARAALEAGVRVQWVMEAESPEDCRQRAFRIVAEGGAWKRKVGQSMDRAGLDGSRWVEGADRHDALVADLQERGLLAPKKPPDVAAQLDGMGLARLYHGYRLASEFGHSTLASGQELEQMYRDGGGTVRASEWLQVVMMSAWAPRFVARALPDAQHPSNPVTELERMATALARDVLTRRPQDDAP